MAKWLIWLISCSLALMLILNSCGFQLRGRSVVPLTLGIVQVSWLDEQLIEDSSFKSTLLTEFKKHRIKLGYNQTAAHLIISQQKLTKQIVNVAPTGQTARYYLIYTINFKFKSRYAAKWSEICSVSVKEDLDYDVNQILGQANLQATMVDELRKRAVNKLILVLSNSS